MPEQIIHLRFTNAEALVLFDWLVTFDETDAAPPMDSAERKALWRLEGKLEETLVEILSPDYKALLDDARKRLLLAESDDYKQGAPQQR
jgi:hypothetical protein